MQTIGQRLKEYRKRLGYTQERVADEIGIAHNTYVRYENDLRRPVAENILKLSFFYHVSPETLLYGEKGMPEELEQRLAQTISKLSEEDIKRVLDFAKSLKARET